MKKPLRALYLALFLALPAAAEQGLVMVRSPLKAEQAMDVLLETIREYGYSIAHIQRCDGGMAEFDYETDFYRVVFFGKLEEVRRILAKHPEMAPYLPLKIAVVAEQQETLLSSLDPRALRPLFGNDEELTIQFARWYSDLHAVLEEVRHHASAPNKK